MPVTPRYAAAKSPRGDFGFPSTGNTPRTPRAGRPQNRAPRSRSYDPLPFGGGASARERLPYSGGASARERLPYSGGASAREKRGQSQKEEHVDTPKRPSSSRTSFAPRPSSAFAASSQRSYANMDFDLMQRLYGTALSRALVSSPLSSRDGSPTPKSSSRSARAKLPGAIESQTVVSLADSLMLNLLPSALSSHRQATMDASSPNSNLLRKPLASSRSRAQSRSVPAHMGVESYLTRSKLKLRETCELDSAEAGELPASAIVSVLEQATMPDGTRRARVAKYGSSEPLGWISCSGKDELRNLIPFDWTRFNRVPPRPSSPPPVVAPSPASPTKTTPEATSPEAAAKPKLARTPSCMTRRPSYAAGLSVSVPQSAGAGASAASAATAAAEPSSTAPTSPEASSPTVRAARSDTNQGAKKKAASAADRVKAMGSDELQETVNDLEAEIANEQRNLDSIWRPANGNSIMALKIKLGMKLMASSVKGPEFAKTWTTDSKGRTTKEVNMMEFRKQVRTLIEWSNVKDIDGLFGEIDANSSGALDITELLSFMKKLHEQTMRAQEITDGIQENIDVLRGRLEFAKEVSQSTLEAEVADVRLKQQAKNVAETEMTKEESIESDKETQRLNKLAEHAWKQAKALQLELRKRRKADEAEAKAKEERAVLEAAEQARANEEARAAKEAKLMAKRLKEQEEQEAYEAKIMARRKSSATAVGVKVAAPVAAK